MQSIGPSSSFGLENHGLHHLKTVYWNLSPARLVEESLQRQEAHLSSAGALVVTTGKHTGRSPNDKFISRSDSLNGQAIWWGKVNQPMPPEKFQLIFQKMKAYLQGKDVFVQDMQVGAHPAHQVNVRVITEKAWASLFAYNLFRRIPSDHLNNFKPEYTVIHCPDFSAVPLEDGTRSETVIAIDFEEKLVLIGGTSYAGEIKKSIFSVLNYLLPFRHVLSMHCSANVGKRGDVALFFGLSGTGKTTLSSDPERKLIGDDEHGWSSEGIFNFEGGCYAKTIHLNPNFEPLIWSAVNRFGTVLENVVCEPGTRTLDFDSSELTENTRAAYPLEYIPNHDEQGYAGHPENIFFLTADAFGVMPPVARLTPDQAMYYFLSGYTSKLAGTEKGLSKEPQATFSACFGSPFLPLHPSIYADMLVERITRYQVNVWLLNTGWTGGPYGVGSRILIPYTRAMVQAVLSGQLDNVRFNQDPCFGLWVPETCPGVPADLLNPLSAWADESAYWQIARNLIEQFETNFAQFSESVPASVIDSGPH